MSSDDQHTPPTSARDEADPAARVGLARVRRRPNIPMFLVTGAFLGLVLGALYAQTTDNGNYSAAAGTAYVAVVGGIVGLVLGAVAVIVLDKRADR